MSLDAFVCGPNGEADWIFKTGDAESKAWALEQSLQAGLIIMGRKSFESMAPYWITSTDPFAESMNSTPKAVFTERGYKGFDAGAEPSAAAASWANAQILEGDLVGEINKLKAEDGKPIAAIGGAGFMRSLIGAGLVDEFHLAIHPVVLGSGLPIFNGVSVPTYLKLIEARSFPGGTVVHSYARKDPA